MGFNSTINPCPDVAALYQLPDSAKSALLGRAVVAEQVTLGVRRTIGMMPFRPLPSLNAYVNCPRSQLVKLSVAVPTACTVVVGGAWKLPPTFW